MKKITYILMLGALLRSMSACSQTGSENAENATIELTDALGNQVTFQEAPSNIVVTGKQTPMIIDLMYLFPNAEPKIVGIENRSQTTKNFLESFSPESAAKIILEKGAGAEQIAALKPDLVILKTSMAEELGTGLQTLGIPTLYVSMESIPELETDITNIGLVLGQPQRAAEVIGLYNQMTADIQNKIESNGTEKKDVLLLQYSEDNGEISFEVPPATWLQTNLVEMAGGNPVWTDAASTGGWATVNVEQIANWNPDIIFIVNYFGNSEETVAQLEENEVWQQLTATQNGTLYGFPGDFISWDQPDSRWILGFNWMAMKINPDAFADMDFESIVSTFYQQFYGIDETTIQQNILPFLYGNF
jgi:iron complex transport system substrate-binding protein